MGNAFEGTVEPGGKGILDATIELTGHINPFWVVDALNLHNIAVHCIPHWLGTIFYSGMSQALKGTYSMTTAPLKRRHGDRIKTLSSRRKAQSTNTTFVN